MLADGVEYVVAKAAGKKEDQKCPDDTEAAKAAGTRLYTRAPVPVPAKDLSSAAADARVATQTTCVFAGAGYSWWAGQLACVHGDNNKAATNMHACQNALFCGTFNPNEKVTDETGKSELWTIATTAHNPVISGSAVWTDSGVAVKEENPVQVRPRPTKCRRGKRVQKGATCLFANAQWECLSKTKCGTQLPTGVADAVWGTPVQTATEKAHVAAGNPVDWDRALGFVDPADKVYAQLWAAGAATRDTAYDEGSEAIGDDSKLYTCAPAELSGQRVAASDKETSQVTVSYKKALKDGKFEAKATTKTLSFAYNVNCARHPPTSKAGKKYWKASATKITAANQPEMDLQPYDADAGYALNDKCVSKGVVYNCKAADFCAGAEPGTDAGKLGWWATPFTVEGVASYKSDGKTKPKRRWTTHAPAEKYAYSKGDRVKALGADKTEYYRCIAPGSACRHPFAHDGSNNGKKYPQALKDVWELDAVDKDYATNYLAENEIKKETWGALARRTKWGQAHDAAAAYKAGDTSCEAAPKLAAWVCVSSAGCAKSAAPATAGGWRITRAVCVIKTAKEMTAAKAEGYAYARGQPYKGGDKVVVGGAGVGKVGGVAYTCVKAEARQCGRVHPELGSYKDPKDAKKSIEVWTQLNGQATTVAAPASKEVEAVPLEVLLANPSIRLRYGQAFQYKGVVYTCTDKTGVLCAGGASEKADTNALYKVLEKVKKDRAEVAKAPVVATFAGGKCTFGKGDNKDSAKGKQCLAVKDAVDGKACLTACIGKAPACVNSGCKWSKAVPQTYAKKAREDIEKELFTELLDTGKGWAQTYDTPKKSEQEWGKLNTKDAGAFAKTGLAVQCDAISTKADACKDGSCKSAEKVPRWWLKGQVYCDAKSETTFTCKDPLLCHSKLPGAVAEADRAKEDFTKIWTASAKTAAAGKLFVQKPDLQATQNKAKAKAFDWDLVTKATYKGTYAFKTGDRAVNGTPARLWECVGKAEDCKATAPKSDTTGSKWRLLTLDAQAWTEAEMTAKSPVTQSCFAWAAGYPFLPGDVVCDPAAPGSRTWTVRDAVVAAANKPSLKDEARLRAAWGLTTADARYKPDGTSTAAVIKFAKIDAPKEGAAVAKCLGWDDRVGAALVDVGAELTWCKGGRVYKCTEKQNGDKKRPCCSKTSPETAGNRCWALQRARGTTVVVTAAQLDADYKDTLQAVHARDSGLGCTSSDRFGAVGTNWKAKTVTEGALKTLSGRVCVADKASAAGIQWLARLRGASVTPRGKISDAYKSADKATWAKAPFNVQVADGALDGAALEEVLAGISYRDAAQRRVLLNVIGWFPGLCGDRPKAREAEPWKAVCRGDIAAALTFALMGEPDALAYADEYKTRKLMTGAAWWQTAFRTAADTECFEAERRADKASDKDKDGKAADKRVTPGCQFAGPTRGAGKALDEKATGATLAAPLAAPFKSYYARGAGPSPLVGPADYNAFSRAVTGSEAAFALAPETLLAYGVRWGVWRGQAVGVMPMAVALWRYVTPQADFLPSVHEVATGGWTASKDELAAGLGAFRGDFCTIVTLVSAMRALQTGAGTRDGDRRYPRGTDAIARLDKATAMEHALPWEQPSVWDGSLGTAWRAIHARLGAKLPAAPVVAGKAALPYDYSCRALSKNAKQAVAKTRGWPVDAKAQKTWLKADTAAQKCAFSAEPGNDRLSIWVDGDVARCEMLSIKADEAKTMPARYKEAKNEPRRQECQLWEGLTNPYAWAACPLKTVDKAVLPTKAEAEAGGGALQPSVHCMACTVLPTSGDGSCDAACVADFEKTKHAMWSCVDARHCARIQPATGAAAEVAWKPWTAYVDSKSKAGATFTSAFGQYRVRAQPLVGTVSGAGAAKITTVAAPNGADVPCVPYPRAFADVTQLAMLQAMGKGAANGGADGIYQVADALRERLYVCEPTHTTATVAVTNDLRAFAAADDKAKDYIVKAADAKGPMSADAAKSVKWVAVTGAMGRIVPTFAERYPDCLPAGTAPTSHQKTVFTQLAGTLEAGFEMLVMDRSMLTDAQLPWNEAYPAQQGGATGAYWGDKDADAAKNPNDPWLKWKYLLAPPTGIAVSIDGNLCTNLRGSLALVKDSGTAAAATPKPTAAARAFIGSISDALFDKAAGKAVTDAKDAAARAKLTEKAGTNDGLANAIAVLTEATFTKLTAGVTGSARAQLKYWEFMAALNAAPALCNVGGSGKLTGSHKRAMCARDLAGLWAAMIATTNSHDAAKATPAKAGGAAARAYHLQGFEASGKLVCQRDKAGTMTDAAGDFHPDLHKQCTAAKVSATPVWGSYTEATGQWCKDAGACAANTVVYLPAGPLALGGVLDTYWFAAHAQQLAATEAASAMRAPAVLGLKDAGSYQYWLSAIYKWMVPMGGRPAPHNIMTGLWEPTALDAAAGVPTGFGAVTKLLSPENCGVASKGVRAQVWRDSWDAMVLEFKLAAVTVSSGVTEAATLTGEKSDCAGADNRPFPASAWAQVPVYLTASYMRGGALRGKDSNRCWGTHTQTKALAYAKGAYAACAWANRGKGADDAAKALTARKAAVKLDIDHLAATTTTAWGSAGGKMHADVACRLAALATPPTKDTKDRTGLVRAALRACTRNADCEKAAQYCDKKGRGSPMTSCAKDGKEGKLVLDVRALAQCPVNSACLARAGGEPARRKACYLLPHAAAVLADKKIRDAKDWTP